ncbi:hypothetical protein H4R27_000297 [Coemansia aciculifera]|nr:hypothetical protein H4R27_000297 [Coemansia aciculifera]
MINKNSRMLHKHSCILNQNSRILNQNSRILIKQNRTLNKHSRMFDLTETQPFVSTLPSEAIPQHSISVQSSWLLAPTPGPLTTRPNTAHTLALHAIGFDAMQTLVPPADGFNISHTHARPDAGPNAADGFAPLTAGRNAADTPMLLTSGFDYAGTLAARVTSFDAAKFRAGPAAPPHTFDSDAAPACSSSSSSSSTAQPSPKRHKVNSREDSMVAQSSDSETGVSNSGQNGSTIIIRDSSDKAVTSDQFSKLFGPFIFIQLDMIFVVYLQLVGHELAVTPVSFQEVYRQLDKIEGFEIWSHDLRGVDGSFLVRRGARYLQMSQRLNCRLKIAEGAAAVVPAPVLYFHLVTLGCVNAKLLSKAVLARMFETATGCQPSSRRIVSKGEPASFSTLEICELARDW